MLKATDSGLQRLMLLVVALAIPDLLAEKARAADATRPELILPLGHTFGVNSVALSGDGKRGLTGSEDKTAILWDAETAKPLRTFPGHTGSVYSVALSGDGKRVLTGSEDKTAILWDAETAKPLRTFQGHTSGVTSVALSGDGKRFLTGSDDKTAILWDAETAKPLRTFQGRTGWVMSVALSGDGKRVLTGSSDRTAILWDAETAKPLRTFQRHTSRVTSVALSGDGKRVLTGSWDKTAILWDAETAKPFRTFQGHSWTVNSVALSGDGKRGLTGSWDRTAILWDAETAKPLRTFQGHTDGLDSVALSGDGKRVLTGSNDKTAILWDAETAKPLRTFQGHTEGVTSVALSGDGKRILTGSWDQTAILWDAETAKPLRTFQGHSSGVTSVALSGDGKRVLTGSTDKTAILWDAETAKPLRTFQGHTGGLTSVALSGDGNYLVTASRDGTVRIWKPDREEPVFSFLSAGNDWLFWTPEGYYTCSPNGENLIAWQIRDDSPQGYRIVGPEQFRKQFYRPDLFRHLLRELDLTKALAIADKESGRTGAPPTTIAKALPPVVLITKPDRDGEIDSEKLTIEAVAVSVGDNPVTRLRLLIDERPYLGNLSTWDVPQPKLGRVKWSKEVALEPGEHTVQVIAENSAGTEGRSEVLRIRRKAVVETLPRLLVLAIGVSAYEKEALRKGVYYCAADARKFADTIERSSKPLYRDIKVVRLIDREATRRKILQALSQMRKQATQRDAVLIFFAGHGKRDDQTNFFFLPVEADLDDLASTGLSEGDFKAAVKALPGRVILLLDACHSGALIENDRRSGDGLTDRLYRDLVSNEIGLVVMCSSKGVEVSSESSTHKSGLFTLALVEGLQGRARKTEGAIYLKDLDAYVTERVKDLSEGRQHPLTSVARTITNIPLTKP